MFRVSGLPRFRVYSLGPNLGSEGIEVKSSTRVRDVLYRSLGYG